MIKLVAFDWNGTILADTTGVVRSENFVRQKFGLRLTDLRDFREMYTIPIRQYWISSGFDPAVFDKKSKEIEKAFLESYEPQEKTFRTRSGAKEILDWLKQNEVKCLVFSNHIVPHIERHLSRLKIENNFCTILARPSGGTEHHRNNFKEQLLWDYVEKKFQPSEIITVGDTDEEIDIAKRRGFTSVALTGGYQSTQRLKAASPDYLIHNLNDLKNIIQQINAK